MAATVLAASCSSDHRVSPWGGGPGPSLEAFAPRPDLEGRLAAIDAETAAHGLVRAFELRAELPRRGGPAVIRGYDGQDAAGRPVHAVRVATPLGVVMAVGPLDAEDLDRRQATELVPALLGGGQKGDAAAFRSGTDLNGDGLLDVALRSEGGELAIWHFDALGSSPYAIAMRAPPTSAIDVDDDGHIDLQGELPTVSGDPIAPRFRDVATFADGRYSDETPAARAWHAAQARASISPSSAPDATRLRASLERAWHRALAAPQPAENVLEDLRRERVPDALRATFDRLARIISALPGASGAPR